MVMLTYIEADGTTHEVEANPGNTLMEISRSKGIPGIDGDCGGVMACATCHVYVDEAWLDKLPKPSANELEMLDCAIDQKPNSRLSCQLKLATELGGLIVRLPTSQH